MVSIELREDLPPPSTLAKWKPLFDRMKPGMAFLAPKASKGSILSSFRNWQVKDATRLALRLSIRIDKKNSSQVAVYLLKKETK